MTFPGSARPVSPTWAVFTNRIRANMFTAAELIDNFFMPQHGYRCCKSCRAMDRAHTELLLATLVPADPGAARGHAIRAFEIIEGIDVHCSECYEWVLGGMILDLIKECDWMYERLGERPARWNPVPAPAPASAPAPVAGVA